MCCDSYISGKTRHVVAISTSLENRDLRDVLYDWCLFSSMVMTVSNGDTTGTGMVGVSPTFQW